MADKPQVVVTGIKETRKLLTEFAPDVKKALDKANRELVKPILAASLRNFPDRPMSNWGSWTPQGRDLSYNIATVRKGLKVKQKGKAKGSQFSAIMQVRNESAAGAIFETAGRKTDSQFTENIQRWYRIEKEGLTRGIWKAVFKDVGFKQIVAKIVENYNEAEKELQKRLDAVK